MIPRLPKKKKMNRYERMAYQQERRQVVQHGSGSYVFENISKGDLWLPKPSENGSRGPIPPGGRWKGDSYFHKLVESRDAKIVEILVSPQEQKMQEKLLVDQPDRITNQGQVEQVLVSEPLSEVVPTPEEKERLITEDPLAGVQILLD